MIKIKIFEKYTNTNEIYNKIMNEYDWDNDDKYGVEYIFTSDNDFTHAILINDVIPELSIKKDNIIGLAQEPGIFLNLNSKIKNIYKNKIKSYFIGTTRYIKSDKSLFIESYSYLFPQISYKQVNSYIKKYPEKNKLINYVYSHKKSKSDHLPSKIKAQHQFLKKYFPSTDDTRILYKYRHILGNNIIENKLPIDIYGNCTKSLKENFPKNNNIHYQFDWKDIHKIYENYKFSIVIENTREEEYFSEKITIPLMCGCIPIYLGCKNINSYFKEYVIHLNGNLNDDINLLNDIINKKDKYYKKINIQEIKEQIHLKNIIHQEFL